MSLILFIKRLLLALLIISSLSFATISKADPPEPAFITNYMIMDYMLRHKHHGTGGICSVGVPSDGTPCSFNPDPEDPTTVYKWCGDCPYGGNGICSQSGAVVDCFPISGKCPSEDELCGD